MRHLDGYNALVDEEEKLPYVVLVVDELADLMLTAPKDVESYIQRLAQKARASGIHLILATQRPSVDVITGVIKANLPCRIAFQTVSKHDSRTILDQLGSEKLIGKGDMLFMRPGTSKLQRLQGAFISDKEVEDFTQHLRSKETASYDEKAMRWIEKEKVSTDGSTVSTSSEDIDEKFDEAMNIARTNGAVSASFLQRQLKIGYNRAARIIDAMDDMQMIGPAEGAGKPRPYIGGER